CRSGRGRRWGEAEADDAAAVGLPEAPEAQHRLVTDEVDVSLVWNDDRLLEQCRDAACGAVPARRPRRPLPQLPGIGQQVAAVAFEVERPSELLVGRQVGPAARLA